VARSRNIKPGFFTNEDLVELDFGTRLLFAGLWTIADREGRLEDRPKKIKMNIFPADTVDVDSMLDELSRYGFVQRYEVNGAKYLQITNWSKHQNPHHTEKASEIPGNNGEITVNQPLQPKESQEQDGGNLADSLIPDSLIPDSPSLRSDSRTAPGSACMAMRKAGMADVNPAHPTLRALLDGGITIDELVSAAADAVAKKKPFAYALAIAEGRRRDAAAVGQLPAAKDAANETTYQRSMRKKMQEWAPGIAVKAPNFSKPFDDLETINVPSIESR
jgi:uncharacterized protein YlbG (UPF0298 family)